MFYPPTKIPPWENQRAVWKIAQGLKSFYVAHQMGAGKTKTAIDFANGIRATRILVICPKKVIDVWPRQFEIHSHQDYTVFPLTRGTTAKKASFVEEKLSMNFTHCVFVTNFETFWRYPLGRDTRKGRDGVLLKNFWDLLIVDEAHRIKDPDGKASYGAMRLAKKSSRILFLSGTPMRNGPVDLYAQFRTLDPSIFGTSLLRFKSNYVHEIQLETHNKIVGYHNLDDLKKKFFSIAHFVSIDDVVDLPSSKDIRINVNLDPKAQRVYDEIDEEFYSQVDSGVITVKNAMVKALRLAQVASGILKTDDGTIKIIDENKVETAAEIIDDLGPKEPVVIFCWFREEMSQIEKHIKKIPGRKVGELSGRKKPPDDFVDGIWQATKTNALIVQLQSGGEGLDFTVTRYGIYLSKAYSPGLIDQSRRRILRPGQKHKVTYFHIVTNATVEHKIERALITKSKVMKYIMSGRKEPDPTRQPVKEMFDMAIKDAVDIFSGSSGLFDQFEKKKKPADDYRPAKQQGSLFEDWN